MAPAIYPVTPSFVAEVGDLDLSQPLSESDLAAVKQAFGKYAVLVFPQQRLTAEQHLALAASFGPLERTIMEHRPGMQLRVDPRIADLSNLEHDGQVWEAASSRRLHELGNRLWHTDSSFRAVPAMASMLYARRIPPVGGLTEFADERAAYDALPQTMRERIAGLSAEHCIRYSRARIGFGDFSAEEREALPPVARPLVRTIPESGRRTLYLASHARHVIGLAESEGRGLVDQLIAHATQRQFVVTHRWREQDLVIWDNRCTMHRGTEYDDTRWPRDVQRATVSDPEFA